jgi:NADH-quinone oxidoreductase subunit L
VVAAGELLDHASEALRWIPLLPLLAAAISGLWLLFAPRNLPRAAVIALGCGAPLGSFAISLVSVWRLTTGEFPGGERFLADGVYTWIGAYPFQAELAFLLDPLSAVMALVVTGVGSLIHVYSVGYMDDDHRDDRGFQRFFLYLNLFMFSMLMLVLGDNLLVLFVGWEGVGLCSYLLIGFWYLEDHNAMCGQKAFVVNRIGDFGFLLGILLVFWAFAGAGHPSVEYRSMAANVGALAGRTVELPAFLSFLPGYPSWNLLTLAGLCFFVGACGKSAQIPLYVWLPDAMAGPTPVSALIHAATMVTAGVYMVVRLSFLYAHAPGALATIAWVGGVTALFAATIGVCQKDIKKVLAYSTVSQLGYMFMAAGVAAYSAAIFHLMTHAFFKALLFLGAGSVILGMHHEQDVTRMGGLRKRMRWTWATFLVGVLAIAGFPPLAGFFSKDEILLGAWAAHDVPGHRALWAIGLVTAGITAFYMFRLYFLVFEGESRAPAHVRSHVHEQGRWILVPLAVLAFFSIVAGALFGLPDAYGEVLLGIQGSNSLHHFLTPVAPGAHHEISHATEFGLAGLAVAVALAGTALAAWLYWLRPGLPERIAASARGLYALVYHKYFVDEIYDRLIVGPLVWLADRVCYRVIDAGLIDGLAVNGAAGLVRGTADRGLKYLQSGFTQSYVFVMLIGGAALVGWLLGGF